MVKTLRHHNYNYIRCCLLLYQDIEEMALMSNDKWCVPWLSDMQHIL